MEVLKANSEQYEALKNFSNGNNYIYFIEDADGNNTVGKEVLTDDKFVEIRNQLEELEVITYNPKFTELWKNLNLI